MKTKSIKSKRKNFVIRLDEKVIKLLHEMADATGRTVSELVREAIGEMILKWRWKIKQKQQKEI